MGIKDAYECEEVKEEDPGLRIALVASLCELLQDCTLSSYANTKQERSDYYFSSANY